MQRYGEAEVRRAAVPVAADSGVLEDYRTADVDVERGGEIDKDDRSEKYSQQRCNVEQRHFFQYFFDTSRSSVKKQAGMHAGPHLWLVN